MRLLAILAAAMLLCGCNMITSPNPLFSQADVQGQGQLRPGAWAIESKDCAFDIKQPVERWPSCAGGWIVGPGEVAAPRRSGDPMSAWLHYPYRIVAGDPPVMQLHVRLNEEVETAPLIYVYLGLEVRKSDAEGRVTAYRIWPALCGPPPLSGGTPNYGALTHEPVPGVVLDEKTGDCTAATQAPVRASAKLSPAWTPANDDNSDRAHWVRDGDR